MEIEDQLISLQRAVDKICSIIAEKTDVTFSHEFINSLTALTFQSIGDTSKKLAYFAKHAKRSAITKDDVKLYFRCSQQMEAVIEKSSDITHGSNKKSVEYVMGKTFTSHIIMNARKLKEKSETLKSAKPRTRKSANYEEKSRSSSIVVKSDGNHPEGEFKKAKTSVNYQEVSFESASEESD